MPDTLSVLFEVHAPWRGKSSCESTETVNRAEAGGGAARSAARTRPPQEPTRHGRGACGRHAKTVVATLAHDGRLRSPPRLQEEADHHGPGFLAGRDAMKKPVVVAGIDPADMRPQAGAVPAGAGLAAGRGAPPPPAVGQCPTPPLAAPRLSAIPPVRSPRYP